MLHQIKHRYTGEVLYECELPDDTPSGLAMRAALEKAVIARANLRYSDLRYSDLSGSNLRGSDLSDSNLSCSNGKELPRATPEQAIENLDKVREIVLDSQSRLDMGRWHGNDEWRGRTCAEEALCGTTHCLAGWLQVCTTEPGLKDVPASLAGVLAAPIASKMFYRVDKEALEWLRDRKYVVESAEAEKRSAEHKAKRDAAQGIAP